MLNTRHIKNQTIGQNSGGQNSGGQNSGGQGSGRGTGLWQSLSGAFGGSGERRSLFSRKGADPKQVKAGRMFRHDDGAGRTETAKVIGLCEILGMTHVRYDLRIDQPGHRPFEDGPRVLGMKTFLDHFCEPLGS